MKVILRSLLNRIAMLVLNMQSEVDRRQLFTFPSRHRFIRCRCRSLFAVLSLSIRGSSWLHNRSFLLSHRPLYYSYFSQNPVVLPFA